MERTKNVPEESLADQMKRRVSNSIRKEEPEFDGNLDFVISTGSTLLDLEISGERIRGGGIPSGIMMEIFGPPGCGKTVLLCEIAGHIQRKGGDLAFKDPEARLNKQFARMFDLDTDKMKYSTPSTVTEIFSELMKWKPKNPNVVNGIMTDSLAALSTNLEMSSKDGDKMGMRRAKEFSEGFRKACRIIQTKNYLMACSNQIRQKSEASKYEYKYISPGGEAIGFYSSLRLRCMAPIKIKQEESIIGDKTLKKVIGTTTMVEVFKSSVGKPFGSAPVTIIFDYGIDDIRQNLQYIKNFTEATQYSVNGEPLAVSMEDAIRKVEDRDLVLDLKNEVISLWIEINKKFKQNRKPKIR